MRLINFTKTENNNYLIFENCTGGDLSNYLKQKGSLSEIEAQRIIK